MPAVIAPLIAEAAIAAPAAAAATGAAGLGTALGASGLAALPSIVSPAVAGIGAGALEAGLATGLGTMGGLGGLATLAPGVSAAANLLGAAAPAVAPSLASVAPGVASTVGQAASGLGSAGGLPSLAQTAGYNAAGFAQPLSQTAQMLNPVSMMAKTAPVAEEMAFPGNWQQMAGEKVAEAPINISTGASGFPISPEVEAGRAAIPPVSSIVPGQTWSKNLMNLLNNPSMQGAKDYVAEHPYASAMGAYNLYSMLNKPKPKEQNLGMIRPYTFSRTQNPDAYAPSSSTAERSYFTDSYTAGTPYKAPGAEYKASGGLTSLAVGGPVETMSAMNAVGGNSMYPQADYQTAMYSNPMMQRPMPSNVIKSGVDANVDPYTGEQRFAGGGLSTLGGYSDGGRLLKGPGDGVSDSIPATIGDRQPARLADGEFVVPARIVSELGNGSTEAGARKLYSMMDRVQKARGKTTGKNKVAANTKADKYLPA